jgi:hypothetical protein
MKLLIMQFPPMSCHFTSLRFKYFPQHSVKKRDIFSLIKGRVQVVHPYRTTGKIIVLYILSYALLGIIQEEGRFWTEL